MFKLHYFYKTSPIFIKLFHFLLSPKFKKVYVKEFILKKKE